ncbi:MAG: hypothetical protein M3460_11220 [Actinomycetota bacterium]|nr:hypothetical protein [Actinomycetota bacterium]
MRIGQGVHSEVFHRPGSRYVVQVFKPECPELTVGKLQREYAYLRAVYAAMPRLIPRLITLRPGASLQESLLFKDYIPHRPELALHRIDSGQLRPSTLDQIRQFLHITADSWPTPARTPISAAKRRCCPTSSIRTGRIWLSIPAPGT